MGADPTLHSLGTSIMMGTLEGFPNSPALWRRQAKLADANALVSQGGVVATPATATATATTTKNWEKISVLQEHRRIWGPTRRRGLGGCA